MALEKIYAVDWVRVACKVSKFLIYLGMAIWLGWFFKKFQPAWRRKSIVILLLGIVLALVGLSVDLLGEFFCLPYFVKRIIAELIFFNVGTLLIFFSLGVILLQATRLSYRYRHQAEVDYLTRVYNRRAFFSQSGGGYGRGESI